MWSPACWTENLTMQEHCAGTVSLGQCFQPFLLQGNLQKMFALLMESCRTVVVNFVPGNFGFFRRNPWQPHAEPWGSAEPRMKSTALEPPQVSETTFLSYRCLFQSNQNQRGSNKWMERCRVGLLLMVGFKQYLIKRRWFAHAIKNVDPSCHDDKTLRTAWSRCTLWFVNLLKSFPIVEWRLHLLSLSILISKHQQAHKSKSTCARNYYIFLNNRNRMWHLGEATVSYKWSSVLPTLLKTKNQI